MTIPQKKRIMSWTWIINNILALRGQNSGKNGSIICEPKFTLLSINHVPSDPTMQGLERLFQEKYKQTSETLKGNKKN